MKIVIAPNAFKNSLTAAQAADAMAAGVLRACPRAERLLIPVADGGDGMVEVLTESLGGCMHSAIVHGPRAEKVAAKFCYISSRKTAIIEMATASGLALLPPERRDPTLCTSFGTGELIRSALDLGAERIVLGIGGSATCEGATGLASALGIVFLDERGKPIRPYGATLNKIHSIDMSGLDARVARCVFEVACDVDNPLLGDNGASRIYSPQKGATPAQVEELEVGLANLAEVIHRELGKDVTTLAGGGAAGGMGAGMHAFFGAQLRKGIDVVLDLLAFDEKLADADLVITAEGRIDHQTAFGKAPAGVAGLAKKRGIPCLALAGGIGVDITGLHTYGINAVFSICREPMTLEHAMQEAPMLLTHATEQAVRAFLCGRCSQQLFYN